MALRFADGGDHYNAATDAATKWTTAASSYTSVAGRFGTGQAIQMTAGNRPLSKVIDAQATWFVGVAVKTSLLTTALVPITFVDGAVVHTDLRMDASGHLLFTRNGTPIGATGTTVLATDTWYYLEVKVTINDTTGVAELKINGVSELTGSALDTRNAGNLSADTIRINGGSGTAFTVAYDDLYVCDTSGGAPTNTYLGDVRVEGLFPNGNGTTSNLVGSDTNSTDNYLLVDETAPAVGDFVESSTVGDKDTYAYTNPTSTSGTVYGVQVLPYAAKTDAGARSIVSVARLSGTEVDSAAKTLPASATPAYLPDIRETKPGGGAWTISDVAAAEFGVKVSA